MNPMNRNSRFTIVEDNPSVLCLRDVGIPWEECLTITNDAERVVELLNPILKGRRLEYYDSERDRTRLKVKDGKFAGFESCKSEVARLVEFKQQKEGVKV